MSQRGNERKRAMSGYSRYGEFPTIRRYIGGFVPGSGLCKIESGAKINSVPAVFFYVKHFEVFFHFRNRKKIKKHFFGDFFFNANLSRKSTMNGRKKC